MSQHAPHPPRRLAVGMALVAVVFLSLSTTHAYGQELTDPAISNSVEDELLLDPAVSTYLIDVSTQEGIVTLSGETDSILAKERATRVAETVKGVRAVVNNIDVDPIVDKSADELRQDVEEALLVDPATESYEIAVDAGSDGWVTLSGVVGSWQEKELAAKVAKGVAGVTELTNNITIQYDTDRRDSEIKADIQQALDWDVLVDNGLIDVAVEDGHVTLTGTVGSAAEKRQAEFDAWVTGVEDVDASGLDVERWARDDDLRDEKYADRSDPDIEDAVEDAFLYDPRVAGFALDADVDNGIATVRGVVDNLRAKRAAAADARNTVGVVAVENRVKVRPTEPGVPDRPDNEITQSVIEALERDAYVERFEIDVNTVNGTVYLSGNVDTFFEKSQAEDVASRIAGVDEVKNFINVYDVGKPYTYEPYIDTTYPYEFDWYDYEPDYTYQPDAQIEEAIESEVWWSPFVDSDDITVHVDDGVATLTGTVDSWSEYESARENAFEGGATWVENDLVIE